MLNQSSSRSTSQLLLAFFISFISFFALMATPVKAADNDEINQYSSNPFVVNQVHAAKTVKLAKVNPAAPKSVRNLKLKVSSATPMQVNHGSHWASKTITYKIDGVSGKYKSAFQYAIKRWNQMHVIKFVKYTGSDEPDIYLRQKSLKALGDYSAGKSVVGLTYTSYYKSDDTLAKGARSYLITDNIKKYKLTTTSLRNTAIHELGHAVGMLHNAKKPSIMYPYVSNQLNISSGDVSSLYKTYKNISY